MSFVLVSLAGVLGILFLWGLVSPRTQWYALVGWTRSNPRETEPGAVAYGVGRFFSLLGLLALAVIGVSSLAGQINFEQPGPGRAQTVAERVWGQPRSFVVDRVFTPLSASPAGLVEQAVDGYQVVDAAGMTPRYLYQAGKIRTAGRAALPGFLGVEPLPGTVALDSADLVVHVRGDDRCIPQAVVVVPVDGAVQVGVFFGQSPAADGSVDVANCDPGPPLGRTDGYLIPIDLAAPLGDRTLQTLTATEIPEVPAPQ